MRYFAGLDLHSNNTYLGILDEKGCKFSSNEIKRLKAVKDFPMRKRKEKITDYFVMRDRVDYNPKKAFG